jgi:hypothetical protein
MAMRQKNQTEKQKVFHNIHKMNKRKSSKKKKILLRLIWLHHPIRINIQAWASCPRKEVDTPTSSRYFLFQGRDALAPLPLRAE